MLSENKDSRFVNKYIHEGFVPLAKITNSEIETYHTDYLGTPKEVTNQKGEIVWRGDYDEYGRVKIVKGETEQQIRFQGQYEDEETELFYGNLVTFRHNKSSKPCKYLWLNELYSEIDHQTQQTTGFKRTMVLDSKILNIKALLDCKEPIIVNFLDRRNPFIKNICDKLKERSYEMLGIKYA